MTIINLPFPLKGLDEAWAAAQQTPLTSPYLNNVRAYDIQDNRARGGQRPALKKVYSQIGGGAHPINAMCQITTINT